MSTADSIVQRFEALVEDGERLLGRLGVGTSDEPEYWVNEFALTEFQRWVTSVSNLLAIVATPLSSFISERDRLLALPLMKQGMPTSFIQGLQGILLSAKDEWDAGLLQSVEFSFAAETFDDFLDKARDLHKRNGKQGAAVLASAVLEDTMKKIAKKYGVDPTGRTLDPLIDALAGASVFTSVKAKRMREAAGIRNHAMHAEWDSIDIRDVGRLIETVRDLVQDYL